MTKNKKTYLINNNVNFENYLKDLLIKTDIIVPSIESGKTIFFAKEKAISASDFIIVYIDSSFSNDNYIEIGIALGKKKSIFIAYETNSKIPLYLTQFPNVRITTETFQNIEFALNIFIDNINTKKKTKHSIGKIDTKIDRSFNFNQFINQIYKQNRETEILESINNYLKKFNFITSIAYENKKGNYADLAIWIDELQSIVKNPILIEFKTHIESKNQYITVYNQTLKSLQNAGCDVGIIIYKDSPINLEEINNRQLPLIFTFNLESFIKKIAKNELIPLITRSRNNLIHNGGING